MTILYLETNFLLSVATGRDAQAGSLLAKPPPAVRFAMPSLCLMEALSVLEAARKDSNRFIDSLRQKIGEARRDATSAHAVSLSSSLEQALADQENRFRDIEGRLARSMRDASRAVEFIHPDPEIVEASQDRPIIQGEPADNLILHCILHHAARHPGETRAFLSENTRDFGTEDVKKILAAAGITKQFSEVRNLLAWIGTLPPGPPEAGGGAPAQ